LTGGVCWIHWRSRRQHEAADPQHRHHRRATQRDTSAASIMIGWMVAMCALGQPIMFGMLAYRLRVKSISVRRIHGPLTNNASTNTRSFGMKLKVAR